MFIELNWAHVALPVWVLVAVTCLASAASAFSAHLLGRRRPQTRMRQWLLRALATALVLASLQLTALLSHVFVYVTTPTLRGSTVLICFGDPHWNMAFGTFLPPIAALAAFLVARRSRRSPVLPAPPAFAEARAGGPDEPAPAPPRLQERRE